MAEDDVLSGVRAAREAFARAHGFDPHRMVAALRALDAAGDWPVIPAGLPGPAAGVSSMVAAHRPPHPPGRGEPTPAGKSVR